MKPTVCLLHAAICLLFSVLVSGAGQDRIAPEVPPTLVAKMVVWQTHWDHLTGVKSQPPSLITFRTDSNARVWVDGLNWIISFDDRKGEFFPSSIQRVAELPDEMKQAAPSSFVGLAPTTASLPIYTNSFHRIVTFEAGARRKLLAVLESDACTTTNLSFYREQVGKPGAVIRFWVAPVDLDFPVLLYVVEGVPYVGKLYFGTRSFKVLYSDFSYIGDEGKPHQDGLKLINAIKQEGDRFELRKGSLVLLPANTASTTR